MNAREYLAAREQFGIKFGLAGIRTLVAALDHPERAYPTLLVAGTNGKGSVVAYVDAALRGAGLRVGRYTSPHLVSVHERIVVDGAPVHDDALERCVTTLRQAAESLVSEGTLAAHPTYFEALTTAAFLHFRTARVEVAVLEVGMGGRLDATNVAEPLASAIVTVERDHEAYLGHTLEAIAREKAGVLRAGRATVVGPLGRAAYDAVLDVAREKHARVVDALADVELTARDGALDLRTPAGTYVGVRPLPGEHQRLNLVVALRLLEEARKAGLAFDPAALAAGLSNTRWPGRLQRIPGRPALLLDGAHNPAGAWSLARHLDREPPFVLLFGAMRDKNLEAVGATLFPLAAQVVLTNAGTGRAASPEEIARRVGEPAARAERVQDVPEALARARALATPYGLVVVAGSLYLVGEVLRLMGEQP